ncbi:TPA: hypothetical protein DEO28_00090 [Candidatus Dependentiae bacterium]|nr:MAG: uDP-N-acetylglucosamine-N-acetylmuramyl-(pentapeptide) pyrophosphoryl-undecaprenol N-acetylglucosamine transferase [candidate division TM6 bacterium GW2011_GWE2_31_21]KKP53996.1 MAG: uDP-N-acetylglucosamine-N-acetylmuramyl-(pentapeptide) pyrophosphoryl-undecaprenol N-acetylglucosamine transferase [candidate division TM6 bacterium GW2011_GWF2_33_332]HBS48423.1 hypothetical protein [Candidatus Dependentiae bacterium]HBZ72903.1 hypothetical protein [Candidatus Dependentiae bacterium]
MLTHIENKKYLAIAAGGSGGHILPAFTLAKNWMLENSSGEIIFFGSAKKIDKKVTEEFKIQFIKIDLNLINFPGKKVWLYPKFCFQFLKTILKSRKILKTYKPTKIISTGGYLSIPVCIAAKYLKTPIEAYELNVVPGRATNFIAPFASKIFVVFEKCKELLTIKNQKLENKIFLAPYPIRFNENDKSFDKNEFITLINKRFQSKEDVLSTKAHLKLGCGNLEVDPFYPFDLKRKTLFVLGGSQGSSYLNDLFIKWLEKNKEIQNKIQIIHQTGQGHDKLVASFYRSNEIPAIVFNYKDKLKDYFLLSDLVICRAGAGTIFELEFFNKKALIIPLQTKQTDHQIFNAKEMVKKHPNLFIIQQQTNMPMDDLVNIDENIKKLIQL